MSLVPQLGMPELLVLAVLVLLVVGPKDLPKFFHSAGQFVAKARRLADEFRAGLSQMAREAELDEMRKEIDSLKKASPVGEVQEAMADIKREMSAPLKPVSDPAHDDYGDDEPCPEEAAARAAEEEGKTHG